MTPQCKDCRYWSDMIARVVAGATNPRGDIEAICLGAVSPHAGRYTVGRDTCDDFRAGEPVDAPRMTMRRAAGRS